ncbi:hypothetical protein AN964_05715 [Heyndrickxia shackletonii]|uniref:Uncharacterized protein n=1 Tax=Heyndrickxia shackletonii TaxID=157838 RepID=A0A0Q3THC5_9BACI|nr:polymer-forming cytoskeletal protein [Heyndrickxia shackletonii]KQL53057.1 hypothetical protein AN964_05715 [Heyndrickxia shackletonii]MBB2481268.1 hypothetical protein [Bacillus sp. APMAM]NEY98614.1 polymer-forming cytoskeletal protein [Heyndrickxia shackletonii]RTZ55411.1 hypothetical protein EKO25_13065 [Bacillus sp. SAJ1]
MKGFRVLLSFMVMVIISALLLTPVLADEKNIVNQKETIIPKNEKVENVIVLGDNATINGEVRVAVVVINGNLQINKTANIKGPVLVIGGQINQEIGAKVTEPIISLNLNDQTKNSFILGGLLFLASWITRLALSILLVLITVIAGIATKHKFNSLPEGLTMKPGRMIITGFISSLALFAISVLLTILIIGIPIVIIILIGVIISLIAGLIFLSGQLGSQLKLFEGKPKWLVLLAGSSFIVAAINFPLFGGIILLIISWFSLGLTVSWLYYKFTTKRKKS